MDDRGCSRLVHNPDGVRPFVQAEEAEHRNPAQPREVLDLQAHGLGGTGIHRDSDASERSIAVCNILDSCPGEPELGGRILGRGDVHGAEQPSLARSVPTPGIHDPLVVVRRRDRAFRPAGPQDHRNCPSLVHARRNVPERATGRKHDDLNIVSLPLLELGAQARTVHVPLTQETVAERIDGAPRPRDEALHKFRTPGWRAGSVPIRSNRNPM